MKSVEERLASIEQFLIDHDKAEETSRLDVKSMLLDARDARSEILRMLKEQNCRISRLEVWRGTLVGGFTVMVFAMPFVWELIRHWLFDGHVP